MSKSYDNTINLSDSEETVKKKVSNMITDVKRIKLADRGHPQECNVFSYYCVFMPQSEDEVYDWCTQAKLGCTDCKKRFAAGLIERLKPLHNRREELLKDKTIVRKVLQMGKDKAAALATKTLKETKEAMRI